MSTRLGIFVSHPVQYHVPIWRRLAQMPELDVKVHFLSDHSIRGGKDPGFGVKVSWDVPLLDGYDNTFISHHSDINNKLSFYMKNPYQFVWRKQFDWVLVAGYMYPFEWQMIHAAKLFGRKLMMRGEFTDLKRKNASPLKMTVRKQVLTQLYKQVDAFACVGEQAKSHLLSKGVPAHKLFFSPYSVDTTEFEKQKQAFSREETRKRLGIDDDTFVFLFSGKLIHRKQIIRLVEAFQYLKRPEKAALLILGDGEQREEVIRKGEELLKERFLFQGFVNQSQLGQYFLAADSFVLPSNYEAWGLVVNEAMQFGLPLVLSDIIGSHKDLLIEGETGHLCKTEDTRDLARAMDLLMANPARAKEMGQNAEELIQKYSTENSAIGIRDGILANN